MKRDLSNDLRQLSDLRGPDLWADIEQRSELPEAAPRAPRSRVPALVAGLLVMVVGVGAPLLALRGGGNPPRVLSGGASRGTGILITDEQRPAPPSQGGGYIGVGTATVVRGSDPAVAATPVLSGADRFLGDAAWSPDGSRVAAVVGNPGGSLDIWTFDAGGGDGVRITSGAWLSAGTTIAWSPDATQLAYDGTVGASFGEGAAAIFLVDADGSNPHPILTGLYGSPTWSPDGTSLLLVSAPAARSDWHNDVVVLDLDSGELTRVTQETATYSTPTWSPDGASVLAAKAGMVDANDQDIVRIDVASGEETVLASGGWNGNPVASPDGSRFAFAHADDGADGSSVVLVASTTDGGQAHEIYAGAWRSYPTSWR